MVKAKSSTRGWPSSRFSGSILSSRNSEDHICEFLESINSGLTDLYFKRKAKKFTSPWMSAEGTFKDNRLQGKVLVKYVNGAELEGDFQEGCINGFGRFRDMQLLVEGFWSQNVLHKIC